MRRAARQRRQARGKRPAVAIVLGSPRDWEAMAPAAERLRAFGVPFEVVVTSAHRAPGRTAAYAEGCQRRGVQVLVVGAGAAAHLAGAIAGRTPLPVIGVPLAVTPLGGLDALYATVQMPSGVPVATVAIGGAENAAILAVEILALADAALARRLAGFKAGLARAVVAQDRRLGRRAVR